MRFEKMITLLLFGSPITADKFFGHFSVYKIKFVEKVSVKG